MKTYSEIFKELKQEWQTKHPAIKKSARVISIVWGDEVFGNICKVTIKIKGEKIERTLYLEGDEIAKANNLQVGDAITINKVMRTWEYNRFEYSIS